MANEAKTIRDYAKEAKKRMKTGFWQEQQVIIKEKTEKAEQEGLPASKVVEYYKRKIDRMVHNNDPAEEAFYLKVKKILDEEGEIAGIIGRLTDKEAFDKLTYEQKQRYTLELSERYRKARERYYEEKEFE